MIKTSGGLSGGNMKPRGNPSNLGESRPGSSANIKDKPAGIRSSAGSMAGSSGRGAKDIKSTVKC